MIKNHNHKEMFELASGLQTSNIREVSDLAKAYLELSVAYDEILGRYIKRVARDITETHSTLFERLAAHERGEK